MSWSNYYHDPITIEGMLGNLYGQREFLAEIYRLQPKTILEVGSGSGAMAIFLSWLGFEVTSIDVDPEVIKKAEQENQRLNGRAKFMVADGFNLPFPAGTFDLAIHQGLLEHFSDTDIRRFIDQELACSKSVLFSVPNHLYMKRDFGNERLMPMSAWRKILSPYHLVADKYYSPKRFPKPYIWRANIQYMATLTGPLHD